MTGAVAAKLAAALAEQPEIGLVQQVDVDVGRAGVQHGAPGIAVLQQRELGLGRGGRDLPHALLDGHELFEGLLLAIRHEEQRSRAASDIRPARNGARAARVRARMGGGP